MKEYGTKRKISTEDGLATCLLMLAVRHIKASNPQPQQYKSDTTRPLHVNRPQLVQICEQTSQTVLWSAVGIVHNS